MAKTPKTPKTTNADETNADETKPLAVRPRGAGSHMMSAEDVHDVHGKETVEENERKAKLQRRERGT